MDYLVNKLRIELNNLIEDYREKGLSSYVISGIISQEQSRIRERELAEMTILLSEYMKNSSKSTEVKVNGQGVQQSKLAESTD